MRPLLLYIRAINVNPNPSDPEPSATGASASFPRPRAALSVCTCSDPVLPLIYRFPCRPSVPSVLSVPLPSSPSPFLQPTLLPFLSLPFSFSVCLTSVSFPRALWCLRIRCSRMSSWCSSFPPTLPWHTSRPTRSPTSAYQQPWRSHVAGCSP